ncbi:hypothetical protein PTTG_25364 [Puccinia triticina 1-1 BBBD Race 1]|uniref:Uncharacterized protein n=1 Tax=Puccinia triticina (isolate 1-1 / race 1 (BBBD)) TaxID=630390 RepID=A0A180H3Q2_PUCT1|nr:hypothetical protein PTTG_25364 [Puccinia triticina 1-1 BBBD Race 1]
MGYSTHYPICIGVRLKVPQDWQNTWGAQHRHPIIGGVQRPHTPIFTKYIGVPWRLRLSRSNIIQQPYPTAQLSNQPSIPTNMSNTPNQPNTSTGITVPPEIWLQMQQLLAAFGPLATAPPSAPAPMIPPVDLPPQSAPPKSPLLIPPLVQSPKSSAISLIPPLDQTDAMTLAPDIELSDHSSDHAPAPPDSASEKNKQTVQSAHNAVITNHPPPNGVIM